MKKKTETTIRFETHLKEFENKLGNSELRFKDGVSLLRLSENLLLRYEEIRKSRDNWKSGYYEIKESHGKIKK